MSTVTMTELLARMNKLAEGSTPTLGHDGVEIYNAMEDELPLSDVLQVIREVVEVLLRDKAKNKSAVTQ
tara:strand:- start:1026 stop:1232 length:207 start_codon:yes stop_codon:yes gene_type:complete